MSWIIASVAGLAAGLLSGMLGVGGGVVMIPALVLLLDADQHTAQGVSLMAIALTALAGALVHHRQGNVRVRLTLTMAPAAVLFSALGAWGAGLIPPHILARAFAGLLIVMGARLVWRG